MLKMENSIDRLDFDQLQKHSHTRTGADSDHNPPTNHVCRQQQWTRDTCVRNTGKHTVPVLTSFRVCDAGPHLHNFHSAATCKNPPNVNLENVSTTWYQDATYNTESDVVKLKPERLVRLTLDAGLAGCVVQVLTLGQSPAFAKGLMCYAQHHGTTETGRTLSIPSPAAAASADEEKLESHVEFVPVISVVILDAVISRSAKHCLDYKW